MTYFLIATFALQEEAKSEFAEYEDYFSSVIEANDGEALYFDVSALTQAANESTQAAFNFRVV